MNRSLGVCDLSIVAVYRFAPQCPEYPWIPERPARVYRYASTVICGISLASQYPRYLCIQKRPDKFMPLCEHCDVSLGFPELLHGNSWSYLLVMPAARLSMS